MNIDNLKDLDDKTRKLIEELQKVTREKDGDRAFSNAQLVIFTSSVYSKQCYIGFEALRRIEETDNKMDYDLARLNIAVTQYYSYENNIDKASEILIDMANKRNFKALDIVVFRFGKKYIKEKCYKKAIELLEVIRTSHPYEVSCYIKICKLLDDKSTNSIGDSYLQVFNKIQEIVRILTINFTNSDDEKQNHERKLAHYTSTDVANILLNNKNEEKIAGSLRLNTISNMNDPSEGQLLGAFLNDVKDTSYVMPEFDENSQAFFSCFTFNHDSLNQFRLYGKKDYQEASGVSLVFKKSFFESKSISGLSFLSMHKYTKVVLNDEKYKNESDILVSNQKNSKNSDSLVIGKQPIMRCVYIDPESEYIQLAQRNKLTFYREIFEDKKIENVCIKQKEIIQKKAKENWDNYQSDMKKKTIDFENCFTSLKKDYNKLIIKKKNIEKNNLDVMKDYETLLDEIILPLRYLIKHSAFQEEQECRMIYITTLADHKVQMDFGKFLYIEYESEVKAHLDKIYIAPAAAQYKPYLAKLLCDTNIRIELSNNPFRLPTSH
ncbi:hypothetical protein ACTXJ5_10705 [Psychrobacter alimentarius]|uniref:hypothetical protein n=1 Tax=Psychrobacter alimentarius TaxID=261164 RepID=UPI003FD42840